MPTNRAKVSNDFQLEEITIAVSILDFLQPALCLLIITRRQVCVSNHVFVVTDGAMSQPILITSSTKAGISLAFISFCLVLCAM